MANGKIVNTVNSVHRRSYTAGDLRFASRHACGRPRLHTGVGKAPAWLPCASGRTLRPTPSPFFAVSLPLFSRRRFHNSVELLLSNQRPRHRSKACSSFASSLRVQQTSPCGLSSPETRGARPSSLRPAIPPPSTIRRGQSSTVHLRPWFWLILFHLDAVVLNP